MIQSVRIEHPEILRERLRFRLIVGHVLRALGTDYQELAGNGRRPQVVLARGVIAALGRELCPGMSYPMIAQEMERPTHSTIIASERRLRQRMDADVPMNLDIGGRIVPLPDAYAEWRADVSAKINAAFGPSRLERSKHGRHAEKGAA